MLKNRDVRLLARGAGVPLWRVADALNVSEPTLTRKLRKELPETEKAKITAIIERLQREGE